MSKPVQTSPFQAMEEEAYHAFREWPIFLVLRQKELAKHLAALAPPLMLERPMTNETDAPDEASDEANTP